MATKTKIYLAMEYASSGELFNKVVDACGGSKGCGGVQGG
ncbi:hypothetical protein Pint_32866 [Pistacia integerrima]|uniref:Uncharacterized protein n=1 Tax=Pistacia integerrima TaxID=434235 RepID=A0ACC0X2K8_9ROSI|nr:hypothetical protein Pint_32866 [Pistacia integerrima]